MRGAKGEVKSLDLPSSAGGLAFSPKGLRVAIAHYGGVTLWFPNAAAAPETFAWKGSHLDVTFSPDGRFLVTAMQEADLAWLAACRRQGHAHVRLFGEGALDGLDRGWQGPCDLRLRTAHPLAFRQQGRPDGQAAAHARALSAAGRRGRVPPKQEIVAVGFEDGLIMLCRIEDGAEILAKKPGSAPVSAIAWSADGAKLAFGTEDGEAGIADLA